jgi:hypothetical protein
VAKRVIFRKAGRFISPLERGAIPYVGAVPLFGAAKKAVTKKARRVGRARRRKRGKRAARRLAPPTKPLRKTFPSGYRSPFRRFLKPVSTTKLGESVRVFLLVEAEFVGYAEKPTRFVPLIVGEMTGRQARQLDADDAKRMIAEKAEDSEAWASAVVKAVGFYALRSAEKRKRLARKHLQKTKKAKHVKKLKGKRRKGRRV